MIITSRKPQCHSSTTTSPIWYLALTIFIITIRIAMKTNLFTIPASLEGEKQNVKRLEITEINQLYTKVDFHIWPSLSLVKKNDTWQYGTREHDAKQWTYEALNWLKKTTNGKMQYEAQWWRLWNLAWITGSKSIFRLQPNNPANPTKTNVATLY